MTRLSLNPPPANSSYPLISHQIHHQPHLFISPHNQPSYHTFFCTPSILDRRRIEHSPFHQEGYEAVVHGGSSNFQAYSTSEDQPVIMDDLLKSNRMKDKEISKSSHGYAAESSKWMPSKMRLMRKMMTTPADSAAAAFQNQNQQHAAENSQRISLSDTARVCSDCNTTSTPLWRSGPKGPKSLCNACGIRKRKARRAMAEAAAASMDIASSNSTNSKTRAHNKEKKPRTNHFGQFKSKSKSTSVAAAAGTSRLERKPPFNDLALCFSNDQAFPDHEVTAAAQLLMELSCGFLHI